MRADIGANIRRESRKPRGGIGFDARSGRRCLELPKLGVQNDNAPFQRIPAACRITGLSQTFLRKGCKAGEIPHVRAGTTYLVNVPALLRQLEGGDADAG